MSITLEQFRQTRREVDDVGVEMVDADIAGKGGFVYAGDVYMTITEGDGVLPRYVSLVLNGWDYYRDESQLPWLEEQLYHWAVTTGALDNVTGE
jgi:hypothetical protein